MGDNSIKKQNSKKRPGSAINSHPLQNHKTLEQKHSDMKDQIKKQQIGEDKKIGYGSFHDIYQAGKDVAISVPNLTLNTKNLEQQNIYDTWFIRALLKIAGEPTIAYGKTEIKINDNKENITYMNKAIGNIRDVYNKNKNIEMGRLIAVLDCFSTDSLHLPIALKKPLEPDKNYLNELVLDDVNFNNLNEADLKTIARHFCKIFLFQMYDRKPDNLLVFEKTVKDQNGKEVKKHFFVDFDFDRGFSEEKGELIHELDCIFGIPTNPEMAVIWKKRIAQLCEQYKIFITKIKEVHQTKTWEEIFKETVKEEYTMTEEKIVKIIQEMTRNAKYIGIDRKEIIKQVQEKLSKWQDMLNHKQRKDRYDQNRILTDEYIAQIDYMADARKDTLEALNKFVENGKIDEQKIGEIVDLETSHQDLSVGLETKPKYRDDSDMDLAKQDKYKIESCDMFIKSNKPKNFFTKSWKERNLVEQIFFVILNIPILGIWAWCTCCSCNNEKATMTKDNVNKRGQIKE